MQAAPGKRISPGKRRGPSIQLISRRTEVVRCSIRPCPLSCVTCVSNPLASSRVSDILCMINLVYASKLKEHEDNDNDYE